MFDEIEINDGSTPEICDVVKAKYINWFHNIDVTGDSTGQNRTAMVRGNLNHYRIMKQELELKEYNLKVPRNNMAHKDSRILCNSVLQNANFRITDNCRRTIDDMVAASVDEYGELIKTQQQGRHFFDNSRYFIHEVWKDFIKSPKKYK